MSNVCCTFSAAVEAITCYDCNSEYDPRCGDPFDPYTLGQIDCNERQALDHLSGANATLCRKLVQRGEYRVQSGASERREGRQSPRYDAGARCGWPTRPSAGAD